MVRQLEGLRYVPAWVSHLGCIKGCLEYLGSDITMPWLYGGTGHAFITNMHDVVCASGPTAWRCEHLVLALGPNLGYDVDSLWAAKGAPDFADLQKVAWDAVRGWLDGEIPCYGWELAIPEYYTVHGYDETGYYYWDMVNDGPAGPKPWQELGDSEVGFLFIGKVELCEAASDEKIVRDAFSATLRHAEDPEGLAYPGYQTGPAAFVVWAEALAEGRASRFGQGFNGMVWSECRLRAVEFLAEARKRLAGVADDLFDEATEHYLVSRDKLKAVSDMHPFKLPSADDEEERLCDAEAAAMLREVATAEEKGLATLGKVVEAL